MGITGVVMMIKGRRAAPEKPVKMTAAEPAPITGDVKPEKADEVAVMDGDGGGGAVDPGAVGVRPASAPAGATDDGLDPG